jgi:hypothetical protein
MACTLIFASIHPEVLEKSIQTCPAGKSTNSDIIIGIAVYIIFINHIYILPRLLV